MRYTHTRGFTLIELLVVIAIIGILASVVLSSLNAARTKANNARRLSDLKQISQAVELYANDNNGSYYVTGVDVWYYACSGSTWDTLETALANYIPTLPHDPTEDCGALRAYYYQSRTGADFKIMAHQPENPNVPPNASLIDPARDGGSNGCVVDSTSGVWAWSLYTSGAACW